MPGRSDAISPPSAAAPRRAALPSNEKELWPDTRPVRGVSRCYRGALPEKLKPVWVRQAVPGDLCERCKTKKRNKGTLKSKHANSKTQTPRPHKPHTWTVLPKPISSPTIPPAPCLCNCHIQRTPAINHGTRQRRTIRSLDAGTKHNDRTYPCEQQQREGLVMVSIVLAQDIL